MTCSLTLKANLVIGDSCATSCSTGCGNGSSQKITPLSLGCGVAYGAVSSTDCPVNVATTGALGSAYTELPGISGISEVLFLSVKTTATVWLLIDGAPAEIQLAGGSYPTGFAGGEAFDFDVDGVSIAGTFTVAAQTVDQVAAELNQAAIGAGLSFLPFSVVGGQLKISGSVVGPDGAVAINTAVAAIGAAGTESAVGAGEILKVSGLALLQFDSATAPSKIYVSGTSSIEVTAAGAA